MTKFNFVAKQSDIIKNIKKLYEYLTSSDKTLSDFAFNLMKRGRAYVAYYDDDCDKWLFAPSRFVGYRSNNYSKHKMNYEKDGKKTCKKIDEILKSGYRTNEKLEMLLKEIFEVPSYKEANRHFWILGDDSKLDKKTMEEQVQKYIEQKKLKEHISYEGRISGKNRKKIIEQLGTTCEACGGKMEEIYGEGAFCDCSVAEELDLPKILVQIGEYAFIVFEVILYVFGFFLLFLPPSRLYLI